MSKKNETQVVEIRTDKLGFRVGTKSSELNETFLKVMGKKLMTPQEVTEGTGLPGHVVRHHLGDLKRKGSVTVKEGRYQLKPVGSKKKKVNKTEQQPEEVKS